MLYNNIVWLQSFILLSRISHYAKASDLQMAAMLTCAFSVFNDNSNSSSQSIISTSSYVSELYFPSDENWLYYLIPKPSRVRGLNQQLSLLSKIEKDQNVMARSHAKRMPQTPKRLAWFWQTNSTIHTIHTRRSALVCFEQASMMDVEFVSAIKFG